MAYRISGLNPVDQAKQFAMSETKPAAMNARRVIASRSRGFGADGNLCNIALALPGEADARIRELFASGEIAYIHSHNAAHGCISAAIERN
jgi:hypothetical protein